MMADIEAETCSCCQLSIPPLANNKDSCVLTVRLPYLSLMNICSESSLHTARFGLNDGHYKVLPLKRTWRRILLYKYQVENNGFSA
jgi:hypothetical protein